MSLLTMFLDPAQLAAQITEIVTALAEYTGLGLILMAIGPTIIRSISWTLDRLCISFIDKFYNYFTTIINGTLLTDSIIKGVMDRIYLIVGVFIVFRLGILLINYIMNPSEVLDEKLGANALIKRVIIGLILIIFMPNIFGYAFDLQASIFEDRIIENIIMSEDQVEAMKKLEKEHGMGKIIGMTIFKGFFSLSGTGKANPIAKMQYQQATDIEKTYDLSAIELVSLPGIGNRGINTNLAGTYIFDYFPILSTIVLGFTLYIMIKYCLDAVVRTFKLAVLQIISPIAIVEYMINKDRNQVFKSWRTATIACYVSLFIRVASVWFVAFITMLVSKPEFVIGKSLLKENDDLLKAIIVLGLLAFMMEIPKLFSDILGLDLEQDAGVKNVMGKIGGAAKMVGGAAMMAGGAAIGSAFSRGKLKGEAFNDKGFQDLQAQKKQLKNDYKLGNIDKDQYKAGMADIKSNQIMKDYNKKKNAARFGALSGIGMAAMAVTPGMQSAKSGFSQATGAYEKADQKIKHRDEQEATAERADKQIKAIKDNTKAINKASYKSNGVDEILDIEMQNDPEEAAVARALKDGGFKGTNEYINENIIKIKDNTKIIRDNSAASLVQQGLANEKLDNIKTNSQVTAERIVNVDEKLDVAVRTTQNIEKNTDTIIKQNNVTHKTLNDIEDNTFHSGIDAINKMENSGYINKPAKNDDDEIL